MLCAISGEVPQEPVVSKKTGSVYEKRLIEKYIEENGKEPGTDEELDLDDLLPIKSARVVRPRPPTLTSIPALLATFQNEWDALALETYNLQEQLARTREELATALYQHDAAVRVIARLTRERDEARESLSKITVSAGGPSNGDAMAIDSEGLPEDLGALVDETHQKLSKGRKKRPIPDGWATLDDVSGFETLSSDSIAVPQATSIGIDDINNYAAISGLQGDIGIFAIDAAKVERSLKINEGVTATLWSGTKIILTTAKGSVKLFDSGKEVASFSEHAGPVSGLAIHPSAEILVSVGSDKSLVFYNLSTLRRASRVYTEASLTTCAFHPDGHLVAAGTVSGDVKVFMTKTGEEATSFALGAPVKAIAFSENGFWVAATAKGQTTVTIFDLRKEGDARTAKVLEIGSAVDSLAWDYSGQFLAMAGPAGVTVQSYPKGSKSWKQTLSSAIPGVCVRWGAEGKKLVAVNAEGVVSTLGLKE